MADYVSKHTGLTIDSTIDRILNGDVGHVQGVSVVAVYQSIAGQGNGSRNTITIALSDGRESNISVMNGTIPSFSTANAGKLMYIDENGEPKPLALSPAFNITNGVLNVTLLDTIPRGEVMSVDENGNATISGSDVSWSIDMDGNATLSGATLTVDENGDATIE